MPWTAAARNLGLGAVCFIECLLLIDHTNKGNKTEEHSNDPAPNYYTELIERVCKLYLEILFEFFDPISELRSVNLQTKSSIATMCRTILKPLN